MLGKTLLEKLPFRIEMCEKLLTEPTRKVWEWAKETHGADFSLRTLQSWRKKLKDGKIRVEAEEAFIDPLADLYLLKMKRLIDQKEKAIERMYEEVRELDAVPGKKGSAYLKTRAALRQDISTSERTVFQFYKEMYALTRAGKAHNGHGGGRDKPGKLLEKIAPDGFKAPEKSERERLEEMDDAEIQRLMKEAGVE